MAAATLALREAVRAALGLPDPSAAEGPRVVEERTSVVGGVRVQLQVTESDAVRADPAGEMCAVALRWLLHHSALRGGDGVVAEAVGKGDLTAHLAAWQGGPLPAAVLEACVGCVEGGALSV